MMNERLTNDTAIVFENVKFLRATTIPSNGTMELYVMVQRTSGNFEVSSSISNISKVLFFFYCGHTKRYNII